MTKIIRVFLFLMFVIVVFGHATPAKAQGFAFPDYLSRWFPQWFGEEEVGPDPSETLRAPFVDPQKMPRDPGANIGVPHRYENETMPNDLSIPHRNHNQIGDWLVRAIAEVLTIDPDPTMLEVHMKRLETGMNMQAVSGYKKFLTDNNVLDVLRTNRMKLNSVVSESPLLLNEGVVEGRYKWLFQVPVTTTYVPIGKNATDNPEVIHQDLTLLLQVGRVRKGTGVQGMMIETWQVRQIGEKIYPNQQN